MTSRRPIPVVYNPTAGGGRARRHRRDLERTAARLGVSLDWQPTRGPGHAIELAAAAAAAGHPLVLAFGGDGTYNEVARGLLATETAMGVMPAGTTSVLAYEFAIPRPVGRALGALLAGVDRAMRVGRTDSGELVLLMLSVGPDTRVLANLLPWLKPLGGRGGVAVQAGIELIRREPMPRFRVHTDDGCIEAGWVIVGNSRSYAGPIEACPGADPMEPSFEIVVQEATGRLPALGFAGAMVRGRHGLRSDVAMLGGRQWVRIEALDNGPAPAFQIDGDVKGNLPVEMRIDPELLLVRLPTAPKDPSEGVTENSRAAASTAGDSRSSGAQKARFEKLELQCRGEGARDDLF